MLRKLQSNVLNQLFDSTKSCVRYSALFINGAKATENFTYVTPHIDFQEKLKRRELIQENLFRRKSNVDLSKVEKLWNIYNELKERKLDYDTKKQELGRQLGIIIKTEPNGDVANKLKKQIDLIKEDAKKLKVPLWSAEEAAILEVLKLPNVLHMLTPDNENKILYTHLSPPQCKKDHLKIGREKGLINFVKNDNYYLKGDAAVFELGAKFHFNNILKKNKFIQFSNPDFVKSLIIEGCGADHTCPNTTFIMDLNEDNKGNIDNRLHLTGGASLYSFFAYHAKNAIYPKAFPLKHFSMGRRYVPCPTDKASLFHVSQSSAIQLFGATKTENELDSLLYEVIDILKTIYSGLGYHFRLSILSAEKLQMWESLRVVVEMYSTSLNSYIEVANVSLSGDFISKRLLFTYVENKETKFPYILSGMVLNVAKILGCVLEQDGEFSVPESFSVTNWIT